MSPIKDLLEQAEQARREEAKRSREEQEQILLGMKHEVEALASRFISGVDQFTSLEELERLPIPCESGRWKLSTTSYGGDVSNLYLDVEGKFTCFVYDSGAYTHTPTLEDYRQAKKSLTKLIDALSA